MRKDYISWDELFMSIAELSSMRSKDPNTQIGACIVDKDNRVVSIGYNGMPNGCPDKYMPWDVREGDLSDTKYAYVCHAEANACLNIRGGAKGHTLYTQYLPCNECAKTIIQSGIKKVVCYGLYAKHTEGEQIKDYGFKATKEMFNWAGVEIVYIPELKEKIQTLIHGDKND